MDTVGIALIVALAVHVAFVTRSCEITEAEQRAYLEALPWTACKCIPDESGLTHEEVPQ